MSLLFKARKQKTAVEPQDTFTRFKRVHLRTPSTRDTSQGVDPFGNPTRMAQHHKRAQVQDEPEMAQAPIALQTPKAKPAINDDLRASLHASGPIPIGVLHMALPLRVAQAAAKAAV